MKRYLYVFCVVLSFYGCEREDMHYSSSLIGEWSWFETCGGLSYTCHTPQSENKKVLIVFTGDSVFNQYINGNLELTCDFRTYKNNDSESINIIEFDNNSILSSYTIVHDTLFLHDYNISDGFSSCYKRKK